MRNAKSIPEVTPPAVKTLPLKLPTFRFVPTPKLARPACTALNGGQPGVEIVTAIVIVPPTWMVT